jgi:hypothetical protein
VKTTIELPDSLLQQTKLYAAERGKTFRQVLIEALNGMMYNGSPEPQKTGIEKYFGAFADEQEETSRIQAYIDEEFSKIDPDDWK